jgi:phospholipid transport system substrate-binding protein
MIAELRSHRASLKSNPNIAYNLVMRRLLPLVDQQAMAQAVLGRNVWASASGSQRQAFIREFRSLVVHTYAAAIAQFSNEEVQFLPERGDTGALRNVKTRIISHGSGRPPINVDYRLQWQSSGWRIIDFSVDGISMVQSFRAQFASQLGQAGLNGLIARLAAHNQRSS